MLEPAAAASSGPFAPTQLYVLLGITIATLGWLWPKEKDGAGVTTGRVVACWTLVVLEILHLIANNAAEIPDTVNVSAHVFLLLFYATLTGVMLSSAQERRVRVHSASAEADSRGNRVD